MHDRVDLWRLAASFPERLSLQNPIPEACTAYVIVINRYRGNYCCEQSESEGTATVL